MPLLSVSKRTSFVRLVALRSKAFFAGCALGFLGSPGTAVAAESSLVTWNQGKVSIPSAGLSIETVLHELKAVGALDLRLSGSVSGTVERDINGQPLSVALKALLSAHNHLILERGGKRPPLVVVLGSASSGDVKTSVTPAGAVGPALALVQAARDADPAVRIDAIERLSERRDAASHGLLLAALHDPVEAVRAVARQALASRQTGSKS